MKRISVILFALVLCVACAAPKYTYNFDYYDYNSGKRKTEQVVTSVPQAEINSSIEVSPLKLSPSGITANASAKPVPVHQTETASPVSSTDESVSGKEYKAMSREDRKAFRKTVKKALKEQVKAIKSGDHVAVNEADRTMDLDLKYAILFGAVGLALALFGGINEVFSILGVISILVGIYFLIKWLIRQ